jgi:O-antigen/teichoic acid export membrane protein
MSAGAYSVGRFRKAALQLVGGRVAQAAARVVLVLAVVRVLPVEDYGAYMLIVGTAEMMLQVGSFGILPLAQRYLPQMLTTLPP